MKGLQNRSHLDDNMMSATRLVELGRQVERGDAGIGQR